MADLRDVGVLVEILDRQGVIADMRMAADAELDDMARNDGDLRLRLEALWERHQAEIRHALATDLTDDKKHDEINSYMRLDDYEVSLAERPRPAFAGIFPGRDDDGPTSKLIQAAKHWAKWAVDTTENADARSRLQGLRNELDGLTASRLHQFRRYNQAARTMAGPAFERLCRVVERLNPAPPTRHEDAGQALIDWSVFKNAESFAQNVHTNAAKRMNVLMDEVDWACKQVTEDAALLHDELRTRVLLARSRLGLVLRYAARSEGFDATRLRDLAANESRNAERLLTLDFAKFLFDQGLTPLIDPTLGGLRPDVLHVGTGDLFYAEAKQYADESPRSALVKAYGQVWGTWGRLRGHFEVREAFLVVFRRSGPRVELPPVIQFRGLRLFSVLADLDKESGSTEKHRPISLSQEELLPSDDG